MIVIRFGYPLLLAACDIPYSEPDFNSAYERINIVSNPFAVHLMFVTNLPRGIQFNNCFCGPIVLLFPHILCFEF